MKLEFCIEDLYTTDPYKPIDIRLQGNLEKDLTSILSLFIRASEELQSHYGLKGACVLVSHEIAEILMRSSLSEKKNVESVDYSKCPDLRYIFDFSIFSIFINTCYLPVTMNYFNNEFVMDIKNHAIVFDPRDISKTVFINIRMY